MTNTSQRLVYQIFEQPTWCLRIFALLAGAPLVRATRRPIRKQTDRSFSSVRFFVTTTNNSFCSCKRHITTDSANRGISDVSSRRQKKFTSIPSPKLYSNTPGSLRQRKAIVSNCCFAGLRSVYRSMSIITSNAVGVGGEVEGSCCC